MKRITISCLFVLMSTLVFAQTTISISGTVTDEKGNPVAFAFIKDAQHNYETFAGPDGTYTLNADPTSRLMVSCKNYTRVVVPVNNSTNLPIKMTSSGSEATTSDAAKNSDAFHIQEIGGANKDARPMTNFGTTQEQLHGSPYLFDHWVHGYAVSSQDSVVENDNYLFNYHKMEGALLYTDNGRSMFTVYKDKANKFVLFDDNGQQYSFEFVPSIDQQHYLQVLSSGSKYKIYKQLNTKFLKADFQTNGITSSGNNYDSYVDEASYYAVKVPGGQPQKFSLKRKSIKAAFGSDGDKAAKYLSDHDSDDMNDTLLQGLGDYMNN